MYTHSYIQTNINKKTSKTCQINCQLRKYMIYILLVHTVNTFMCFVFGSTNNLVQIFGIWTVGCGIFFSIFEHRLHKILIRRAFFSPRQGYFKTVFFSEIYISRIFWLQSLGYIETPTTKIESILKNVRLTCKNPAFWKISELYRFVITCAVNF